MEYVYTGMVSLAVAILAFVLQNLIRENIKLKRDKNAAENVNNAALKDGLRCLLRASLMELHSKYMAVNTISTYEYENWTMMYKSYKELGGNGMITHMNEDIEELKMKE